MSYRFMRTILFFDLPTITSTDRRNYRKFIKLIKSNGYYMIQESVYVKMSIDIQRAKSTALVLKSQLPPDGSVFILHVTEKQFASMEILLGESNSEFLSNDERLIKL